MKLAIQFLMQKINNKNESSHVKGKRTMRNPMPGRDVKQGIQPNLDREARITVGEIQNGLKFGNMSHKFGSRHSGTFLEDVEIQ